MKRGAGSRALAGGETSDVRLQEGLAVSLPGPHTPQVLYLADGAAEHPPAVTGRPPYGHAAGRAGSVYLARTGPWAGSSGCSALPAALSLSFALASSHSDFLWELFSFRMGMSTFGDAACSWIRCRGVTTAFSRGLATLCGGQGVEHCGRASLLPWVQFPGPAPRLLSASS